MTKEKELVQIASTLRAGGVGILPTDTLYGLVGCAKDKRAVERIKKLKRRSPGKPFIFLISSLNDLTKLGQRLDPPTKKFLRTIWPGPVSVAFNKNFSARWPKNKFLNELTKRVGPIIAPSANPEGLAPAETITVAKKYFSDQVDLYLSAKKKLTGQPSTLIAIKKGQIEIIRPGRIKIKQTII